MFSDLSNMISRIPVFSTGSYHIENQNYYLWNVFWKLLPHHFEPKSHYFFWWGGVLATII